MDQKKKFISIVRVLFVTICSIFCIIPLVGMIWAPTTSTTENRELAEMPALFEDGTLNTDILSDLGSYFEDHFAYRNEFVSINAELRAAIGVSATDSVIVGTEGWLYYSGTLSDYCGWNLLSSRAVDNIAFNLSLMQGYANAYGAEFVVTFAPNKNSLYSENMPYYYTQGEKRNLTTVEEMLDAYGVNYVSMEEAFSGEAEVLYYLRDTHWNTKGALFACMQLLENLGCTQAIAELESLESVEISDYIGDINSMLFPVTADPETDYSYDEGLSWTMISGESVEDLEITTTGYGSGTLLMYRDSFANNMIPFLADVYETAYFTKMVPYDLTEIGQYGATTVIIERAERNLSDLGTDPGIMPAPSLSLEVSFSDIILSSDEIEIGTDGDYTVIQGTLPEEYWDEDVLIYVGLEKTDGSLTWYVPFHLSTDESDYGFKAWFYESTYSDTTAVWLACVDDEETTCVGYIETSR